MNEQQLRTLWLQSYVSALAGAAVSGEHPSSVVAKAVNVANTARDAAAALYPSEAKEQQGKGGR